METEITECENMMDEFTIVDAEVELKKPTITTWSEYFRKMWNIAHILVAVAVVYFYILFYHDPKRPSKF
jgi:hypothetical protein